MSQLRTEFRHPWLPSNRMLGVTSVLLGGVAALHMVEQSGMLTATALALLTLGSVGGITYERRAYAREAVHRTVSCKAVGCHEIHRTQTLDLSPDGFFVQTDVPYPLLTRFRFELELAEGDRPVLGQGVVRWINRHTPRGMGIEIVALEEPERFARLLEEARKHWTLPRFPHSGPASGAGAAGIES